MAGLFPNGGPKFKRQELRELGLLDGLIGPLTSSIGPNSFISSNESLKALLRLTIFFRLMFRISRSKFDWS